MYYEVEEIECIQFCYINGYLHPLNTEMKKVPNRVVIQENIEEKKKPSRPLLIALSDQPNPTQATQPNPFHLPFHLPLTPPTTHPTSPQHAHLIIV